MITNSGRFSISQTGKSSRSPAICLYHRTVIIAIRGNPMVICPVAIAVGCKKCPIFKVCPAKSIIGDQKAGDNEGKSESKPAEIKPKKS